MPDPNDRSLMHYVAEYNADRALIGLVSHGYEIDSLDNNKQSPLMIAIENKNVTIAKGLIELGADIEIRDSNERTPLMIACKVGSPELVDILIKNRANIEARSSLGDTAMTLA